MSPGKKIICVLGMHRSGTSVVSKMLSLLGADLGPGHRVLQATSDNPKGFWEHTGFVDINDEILTRFGGDWHNPPEFPDGWPSLPLLADLRERATNIIEQDFGRASIWSWKDPRTCLTIPFWQALLPSMHYVVCVRDPRAVARSLERRNGFSTEKSGSLWLSHVGSALRWTSGRRRIVTFYEDIMEDCESELSRLAAFLEVPGSRLAPRVLEQVRAFVDQSLYHHRRRSTDGAELSMALPVESLYLALRARFSNGAPREQSGLDAVIDAHAVQALEEEAARAREIRRTAGLLHELGETRQQLQALMTASADRLAAPADTAEHEAIVSKLRARISEESYRCENAERRSEQLAARAESSMRLAATAREGLRLARAETARQESGRLSPLRRFIRRSTATARALGVFPPRNLGSCRALLRLLAKPRRLRDAYVIAGSEAFDEGHYLRRYQDVARSRMSPLMHFVLSGAAECRHPHPLFDTAWYLWRAPDVAMAGRNALAHLIERGGSERRDPHPFFSSEFYLSGLDPGARLSDNAFLDYLACGSRECRAPHPLFDPLYYLELNPDVLAAGIDPLVHFMTHGAFEGRSPHPLFDLPFYLDQNRDVATSGLNPLLHYRYNGAFEGRNPHPLFAVDYYLTTNPDVQRARLEPLTHFLTVGGAQGRNPSGAFDCAYYASQVPEVAAGRINPLVHFVREGWQIGLNPSKNFDTASYLREHEDVRQWGGNPLVHYIYYGRSEMRVARIAGTFRSDAAVQGGWTGDTVVAGGTARETAAPRRCDRFAVYTSSLGNYFLGEVSDLLAAGLTDLGFAVERRDESQGFSEIADWHVVVAPHEFFYLGSGQDLLRNGAPRSLVLLNTVHPSTPSFSMALACFSQAHTVWDIAFESARLLSSKGYRCAYLPLGYSARFEAAQEVPVLPEGRGTTFLEPDVRKWTSSRRPRGERPIDILFVGHMSARREQFFARAAAVLSRYRCYFHFSSATEPVIAGRNTYMNTPTVMGLTQRSKIVLNIHHGAHRRFEWHRIVMQGIWQRALVVSEPCDTAPPFKPGLDFVEAPLDELPSAIGHLLSNPDGRADADRIVEQGFLTLTQDCRLAGSLRQLILDLHNVPEFPAEFREAPRTKAPGATSPLDRRGVAREETIGLTAASRETSKFRAD